MVWGPGGGEFLLELVNLKILDAREKSLKFFFHLLKLRNVLCCNARKTDRKDGVLKNYDNAYNNMYLI